MSRPCSAPRQKPFFLEIYFACALAYLFDFIYVDLSRAHRFQTINLFKDDLRQFICPFGIRAETNVDTILLARKVLDAGADASPHTYRRDPRAAPRAV